MTEKGERGRKGGERERKGGERRKEGKEREGGERSGEGKGRKGKGERGVGKGREGKGEERSGEGKERRRDEDRRGEGREGKERRRGVGGTGERQWGKGKASLPSSPQQVSVTSHFRPCSGVVSRCSGCVMERRGQRRRLSSLPFLLIHFHRLFPTFLPSPPQTPLSVGYVSLQGARPAVAGGPRALGRWASPVCEPVVGAVRMVSLSLRPGRVQTFHLLVFQSLLLAPFLESRPCELQYKGTYCPGAETRGREQLIHPTQRDIAPRGHCTHGRSQGLAGRSGWLLGHRSVVGVGGDDQ